MGNIILDFDGTIGDTQGLIVKTLQDTMRKRNLDVKSKEDCAKTIGLKLEEGFQLLYSMSEKEADACAKTYREIFEENKHIMIVDSFPHVVETIQRLYKKGFLLAVASSRSRSSLLRYLDQLHITDCISCIVAADDVSHVKSAPDMVFKVLDELGGKPEESIVVGDMIYDVEMGKNAGTKTCGVTYGNGTREQLSKADYVIDDFAELLNIVEKEEKQ